MNYIVVNDLHEEIRRRKKTTGLDSESKGRKKLLKIDKIGTVIYQNNEDNQLFWFSDKTIADDG